MSPVLVDLAPRRNSALKNNPPLGAQAHITTKASDWLWCVFAIFLFVDIGLFIWCVFRRPGTRLLNQLAIIVLTISTWAYFAEASDLGWTAVPTVFNHYTPRGTLRQTWWVRYVDWILTLPLILVMVSFAAGSHWRVIMSLAFAGAVVWTGWLLGAVISSQYKWAYYVFGIVMGIFYIYYALLWTVRSDAERLGGRYYITQISSSAFICFMLVMYAVAWGCCEGANTVSNSSEMVWYGILDCFSKPFWLIYFLWMTKGTDYTLLREVRYTHEHAQYQAEADAATSTATGVAVTETAAGPRSRFAPIVGPRKRGGFGTPSPRQHNTHATRTLDENVGHTDAPAAVAATATTDAEKAAANQKYRKFFSRRGAHDVPTVPAVQTAEHGPYQPTRTSNATMVESDATHQSGPDNIHPVHPIIPTAPGSVIPPPPGPIVPPAPGSVIPPGAAAAVPQRERGGGGIPPADFPNPPTHRYGV